jgi:hypothetical protein
VDARGTLDGRAPAAVDALRVAHDELPRPVGEARRRRQRDGRGRGDGGAERGRDERGGEGERERAERAEGHGRAGRPTWNSIGGRKLHPEHVVLRSTGTIEGWPSASSRATSTS